MRSTRRAVLRLTAIAAMTVLTALPASRAPAQPIPKPRPAVIPVEIATGARLWAEAGLTGQSGWMVIDLDTGQVLDQQDAARAFVPASVAKLPTAAFALDALGPAHRFETRLLATGPIRNGRIQGDLILSGGGDPELDTDAFPALVEALIQRGVRGATGRFLADGSALPQVEAIEPDQAEHAAYNPSVSGLNLNFNRVHVKWDARQGRGELSVVAEAERLSPEVSSVQVDVAATPGQPLFTLSRRDGQEHWQMAREAFRGRAARWLPVKRPEGYAGEVFRTVAAGRGIELAVPEPGTAPAGAEMLAVRESRRLGSILTTMLRYSTNLTAEVTGTAASRSVGTATRDLAGSAAIMNIWAAGVAGFEPGDPEFAFTNHSGLSLENRVSPRRMVALLAALARRQTVPGLSHDRLPGAIAGYLPRIEVADDEVVMDYDRLDVVAKTGTMNYVRGLAGYIATPGGRRLAFAIFSNDLSRRAGGAEHVNRGWMGRARGFEKAMIRNWVLAADQTAPEVLAGARR